MRILHWLHGHLSTRGKGLSLYRRGMQRAVSHDNQGAIEDYTATISLADIPSDLKAMALFNRALVYSAAGENDKATVDLQVVLAMAEPLVNVKCEARRKLGRMQRRVETH